MDDRLYGAFDRIYEREFSSELFDDGYIQARELVDGVVADLRTRSLSFRPDARVALLSNALALGVLPSRIAEFDSAEWMPALRDDLYTICLGAAQGPNQEITSGAVIASAAANWDDLKTAVLEFWD